MLSAKVFENGRSQAVRLPKEYRFEESEVMTHKIGDIVMLIPKSKEKAWSGLLAGLELFSDDFMSHGRADDGYQEREAF